MNRSKKQHSGADITVIIPLFNKEASIRRALLSVVNQTPLPGKVIVVDDGSTDKSAEIVDEISELYPFIHLISQENTGVSAARNRGAQHASTKYICFLDADDQWEPGYLEELLRLIREHPEANFYGLRYRLRRNNQYEYPPVFCSDGFSGVVPDFITAYRKGYGLIHSSSVCFKKEFFLESGGFPEGEPSGEDIYMWLLAGINGTYAFSNQIKTTVFKENVLAATRRAKHIPFHISWFSERLADVPEKFRIPLRLFLMKNLLLQWAAAKMEQNAWQCTELAAYARKISPVFAVFLKAAGLLPADFFRYLAEKRVSSRQR